MAANPVLVKRQGIDGESVRQINILHDVRESLHECLANMNVHKHNPLAREIVKLLYDIEAELQRLWKFPINVDYYKFWNVPGCVCAGKIDNEDAYPTGYYVVSGNCPLHGEEKHMFLRGD